MIKIVDGAKIAPHFFVFYDDLTQLNNVIYYPCIGGEKPIIVCYDLDDRHSTSSKFRLGVKILGIGRQK